MEGRIKNLTERHNSKFGSLIEHLTGNIMGALKLDLQKGIITQEEYDEAKKLFESLTADL